MRNSKSLRGEPVEKHCQALPMDSLCWKSIQAATILPDHSDISSDTAHYVIAAVVIIIYNHMCSIQNIETVRYKYQCAEVILPDFDFL